MRYRRNLGLALFLLALTAPVGAHHAHGNYAPEFSDLEGVVKEVHLLNPHSWVYLEVKNAKGELEMWAIEAAGRTGLQRIGVDANYIKPGDRVKARCHFLRTARPAAWPGSSRRRTAA
jgi:hypothetical protein